MMNRLFDFFMYFKRRNFTVTREFKMGDITVKEYTYNMKRYYTDTWPPNTSAGTGFPIMSVIREGDCKDVTNEVLKFSGPRKNYVNPLSLCTRKKRIHIRIINFGIRVQLEDSWSPYEGDVTVIDILGGRRTIQIDPSNFKAPSSSGSEIYEYTIRIPGRS